MSHQNTKNSKLGITTRLAHAGRNPDEQFGFVNTPIYRGSTVLYPTVDAINKRLKNIRFKAKAGVHKLAVAFRQRTLAESEDRLQMHIPGGGQDRILRVNSFEVQIDTDCSHIIVKRQPAATDLRLIMAVTKTVTDLERIGDEAHKMARMARQIHERGVVDVGHFANIRHTGDAAVNMLRQGLDAFARLDVEDAGRISQSALRRQKVEKLHRSRTHRVKK